MIRAELAKLAQRRVPPILPNLAEWLRPFQGLSGPINPDYRTPQTLHQAFTRLAQQAGVQLGRNTFRNCYISYRVAQPYASALVAQETGTSVKMIEANYKELVTSQESAQWFAITPTPEQLAALQDYAAQIRSRSPGEPAAQGKPSPSKTKPRR